MAKRAKAKPKPKVGGPFLAAAVFCESVMEGPDKALSAIRIIDQCNIWLAPDAPKDVPSKTKPFQISQNMLLTFRSGDSPGKHKLRLVIKPPSGKAQEVLNQDIKLGKEPHAGMNIKSQMNVRVHGPGLFWIDVRLDGKLFTRMPLQVNVHRMSKRRGK